VHASQRRSRGRLHDRSAGPGRSGHRRRVAGPEPERPGHRGPGCPGSGAPRLPDRQAGAPAGPDAPAFALIAAGTGTDADRVIADNRLPREHVDPGAGDALFVVRHYGCGFRYQLILYEDRARLFVDPERIGRHDDCRYATVEVAAFVVPAAGLPQLLTSGVGPEAGSTTSPSASLECAAGGTTISSMAGMRRHARPGCARRGPRGRQASDDGSSDTERLPARR
jgi:hypothetical protein